MANSQQVTNNINSNNVQDVFNFLKKGEKHIKYSAQKDIILILGVTGSGKSTFTQYMAGNNDNLISKEIGKDSGEFIIEDNDNEISRDSINSHTIFPKLILDPKTNIAFYDCPGFDDTRSAAHDISATYFIKKIIDSADSIKLVFTVSYPSVRQGVDRQAFMLLVKHAVKMVKNIKKFQHSIALVVTKVDNQYVKKGENYNLVPDENIIANIAIFLKEVKDDLQSKISLTNILNDQRFYKQAVQFLNILLDTNNQKYTNIGIFRRPNESGVLSNITLLQDGKKSLEKILHEIIQFSPHIKGDFGYSISSDSQIHVHGLVDQINENIASAVVSIGQEIRKYYDSQEERSRDIQKAYDKFKLGYHYLSATKTALTTCKKPQDLVKEITKNINDLNINISNENLLSIINYAEYLTFIKSVSTQSTVFIRPLGWAQGLSEIVQYLNQSLNWYNFLLDLHATLSTYNVQQNIVYYTKAAKDLKYQIALDENQRGKLTSIKQFLDLVSNEDSEREYNNIQAVELNKSKLKSLNDLLDATVMYNVFSSCIDDKLVLKGQYVKLSDIARKKNSCQAKFIEIFALNKVFIETDLDETGNQVQLSIVAPKWDIIGSRKIILDGASGETYTTPKADSNGEDGGPGKSGGPAGNFVGVGHNFINGKYLSIFANGGKGGSGQDGGDGANGKDGTTPHIPNFGEDPPWNEDSIIKKTSYCDGLAMIQSSNQHCRVTGYEWLVVGESCSDGGNGGNGGIGGKGGKAGNVMIIDLNRDSNILVATNRGGSGIIGTGGRGGRAGVDTGRLQISADIGKSKICFFLGTCAKYSYTVISQETIKMCTSGVAGMDGKNARGIQHPKEAVVIYVPTIINDYKKYVRENLSGSVTEKSLRKFVHQLENNSSLEDLYDTLAYINELQGLEDQFYKLRTVIPCSPFYKSLLDRISKYAEKLYNKGEMTVDNKKVLSYLYTATLSKIYSLTNNVANHLVVDLERYLNLVIKDINKFKTYSDEVSIDNYQNSYQKVMDGKINEAKNFIETKIMPEIDNVFDQIDDKIELLISQTVSMQNAAKGEERKLIQNKNKLKDAFVFKNFLGITKIVSQFLSFAGPVGLAVGTAVGAGAMVVDSLAFNDVSATSIAQLAALPVAVKKGISIITDNLKLKQQLFKEQLLNVEKDLGVYMEKQPSDNLRDVKKKIYDIKVKLEEEIAKDTTLDVTSINVIQTKRKEVKELLEKEKEILERQKPDVDINIKNQLKILNRIATITEISTDFFDKIRNDQAKIDIAADAIKQADIKIKQLMQYEKEIYKTIIPTCKGIENSVKEVENHLKGKSHVALDISKWQIQSTLKDVKLQMQIMTKGMDIEEDLVRCIEKIEEGLSVMVDVYQRIEDYHYKAEFTDYISNIVSNKAREIRIDNKLLNNAIDNLKLIIQSNVVLEKYEIAMDAFKQHVYPFADSYIAEFNLPSHLRSNDTNSLMWHAANKIEHLNDKKLIMDVIINKYDQFIHNNITFNSESNRTSPFFVWKYDKNKHTISKLLTGKEITIKSDITQGLKKNAVKFSVVGIHFKLLNETIQHEVDEQLQNFKVTMRHSGNSYYRCDNNFHLITSDAETIDYSLGKHNNGDLLDKTSVYDKLKNNEPVLSPYTMWNIKLSHILNDNFDTLAKYKNQVMDLELEGIGQYIDQGIDVCNDVLNKYYTLDDTISEINNIDLDNKRNWDEIPDIRSSIISNNRPKEIHNRKRRDVDDHNIVHHYKESSFATSGASNMQSSSINNIFNLMGIGLTMFKYLNPVNKIANWFIKDEINTDQEALNVFGTNVPMHMKLSNTKFLHTDLPEVSNTFADNGSATTSNLLNNLLFCSHGNLLLLDLIIRCKSGVKYKQNYTAASTCTDFEYAQTLAYRQYVPNNI